MAAGDAAARARRLGVLLAAIGEEPAMRVGESLELGTAVGAYDLAAYDEATDEDRHLAQELAAIARRLRARQWRSLEALLAVVSELHGELEEPFDALPDEDVVAAARALVTLGWVDGYR